MTFDSFEVRRSDGPEFHGAVEAWRDGFTGEGSAIAIIDTGIDINSPEFAGRILPASRSVAGDASFEAEDDHGTNVALIAAAALNDLGVVGIAYEAGIIALRADQPGSCNDNTDEVLDGCRFLDTDIAEGVDAAVAAGAAVVNISLGGSAPSRTLREAVSRAAAAGLVIVVAAGNDGDSTDAGLDPDNPDPLARGLLEAGGNNVIIVGSVDEDGVISGFSNRAGELGASFLLARGEEVCCVYEDGEILVETIDGQQFVTVFSGTSFAAPQVSGAVALLAQAFPNLSGEEIVELLLDTARDGGLPGTDPIYGSGILDIAAAFRPQGTTSLAGTGRILHTGDELAIASPAMGDALAGADASLLVTDRYGRAFSTDIANRQQAAARQPALTAALTPKARSLSGSAGGKVALAFAIEDTAIGTTSTPLRELTLTGAEADAARVLAATAALRAGRTDIGFGFQQEAGSLAASFAGADRPAFFVAPSARNQHGFGLASDSSIALRHDLDGLGVSAFAGRGEVLLSSWRRVGGAVLDTREGFAASTIGVAFDFDAEPVKARIGLTHLDESRTVLGAYLHDSLGARGARTFYVDAGLSATLGRLQFALDLRGAQTALRGAGQVTDGSLLSSAWSLDAGLTGLWQTDDRLTVRLAQPLRVEHGGLELSLPTGFNYAAEQAVFSQQFIGLSPSGRELVAELGWQGKLLAGDARTGVFYRRQPGHIAGGPSDVGGAFTWSLDF